MKQGIHAMAIAIAVSFTGPAQAQTTSASPFQIVEASIDDIHTAFRSGRLTARQLVQGYLDRINAYDRQGPNINSVITINPDALAEADRLDAAFRTSGLAGPLHGIAILVKDEIDTAGMPTTLGTVVFKDYRPPKDAFVIDKLRKAGAARSSSARRRYPNSPPATPTARSSASRATPTTSSGPSAVRPAAPARLSRQTSRPSPSERKPLRRSAARRRGMRS